VTRLERDRNGEGGRESGFGRFLRSLLAGVPWSEHAERQEELLLANPRSGVLRVHNANGRTRLVGEERTDIAVVARRHARAESSDAANALLDSIQIFHEDKDNALELEVDVPRSWNRRGYINLELRVPRGLNTEIVASNGRLVIENLRGSVRARSSNGAVDISDVVGDVQVATSNAKVCSSSTCGRLVVRSSNGKIELDDHRGSVDASTSNGLIRCELDELGEEGVRLSTSNGRILLELPEELDAELDVRVDNGVIRNERELCKAVRERSGQLRGRLGRGGALIKLRTSNGSVCLK